MVKCQLAALIQKGWQSALCYLRFLSNIRNTQRGQIICVYTAGASAEETAGINVKICHKESRLKKPTYAKHYQHGSAVKVQTYSSYGVGG